MKNKTIKELEDKLSSLYEETSKVANEIQEAKKQIEFKKMRKKFPTVNSLKELIPLNFKSIHDFSQPKVIFDDFLLSKETDYIYDDVYSYSPSTVNILKLTSPSKGSTTYWSMLSQESSYSGFDSYDLWSLREVKPVEVTEIRWIPVS